MVVFAREKTTDASSTSNILAETMLRLHSQQGYTASARDLHSNFALYRELAELLNVDVSSSAPSVLFFHGSAAPPQEILFSSKGFDLSDADPCAFAGRMFYGSVASKAATYARPYLYLCMMAVDEKETKIFKPKDRADALSDEAGAADILLIGEHTKTEDQSNSSIYFPRTFEYPELAIRDPTKVVPVACFIMDCPMLSHCCSTVDAQRKERLFPCINAQAGAFEAWVLWKEEEEEAVAKAKKAAAVGGQQYRCF
jgi:hypothetical protein